jgi:hypothetical protein
VQPVPRLFGCVGAAAALPHGFRLGGEIPVHLPAGDAAGLRALIVRSVIACHGLDEAGRHGGALMEDAAPRPP